MNNDIKMIENPDEKTAITLKIMHALSAWFSPPADIEKKAIIHREYPFFAAYDGDVPVGFIALKIHNQYTADIFNLGVLEKYHRKGIGRRLLAFAEKYCAENGYLVLTVKTLDSSVDYEPYNRTRAFYEKMGFIPLEVFTTFWNEENPCLFMAKWLQPNIIKTTKFRDNPGCKVFLEETRDGRKHVRKSYNSASQNEEEWDAMCFLYNAGFNVPEPYKRDEQGIYMQYIDNGVFWDIYKTADTAAQPKLADKFVKLLHDFHNIKPKNEPPSGGFIKNELAEIKTLIENKQIAHYWDIFNTLETLSSGIDEYPSCYVHRDYHVWNVLANKNENLYLIDMALTQGDFRFDVGWTYMLMRRSAVHDTRYGDFAEIFLSGYYQLNPNARNDIEYFKQLANLRWLVNVTPENKSEKPWFPEMMAVAEQAIEKFITRQ